MRSTKETAINDENNSLFIINPLTLPMVQPSSSIMTAVHSVNAGLEKRLILFYDLLRFLYELARLL